MVAEIGTKKKGCMEYLTTIKSKVKPRHGLKWHTFFKTYPKNWNLSEGGIPVEAVV
jgi:hypothetical protein